MSTADDAGGRVKLHWIELLLSAKDAKDAKKSEGMSRSRRMPRRFITATHAPAFFASFASFADPMLFDGWWKPRA